MSEFCAHRAKTYAFLIDEFNDIDYKKQGIINKKAKGAKKCVIPNQITFKDYVNVLFNKVPMIKSQFGFRSRNHEIYTEKINKITFSSNDNKRIKCDNGINTYPYGYFDNDNNNKVDNKSELDILREEAKALLNNSKIVRKEANIIQNTSKIIRKEINNTIKESHAINENNTKSDLDTIKKEPHTIKENNIVKKEPHTKSELDILRENAKALRNNSKILRKEANTIQNNSKILRKEINDIIKESHTVKYNNVTHKKKDK